jgi:hypothetical protein
VLARLPARRRDLGPDHVDGQWGTGGALGGSGLRSGGQLRGPLGGDLVRERTAGVVRAAHARVEVDLLVAGEHVLPHHLGGALHRRRRAVLRRERMWPQVIAAEHQALRGQSGVRREPRDERHELLRLDAGVAAILVDLVRGRLDQHARAVGERLLERRLEHERVRRADRRDPARHAALLLAHDVGQHGAAACRAQRSHLSRFSSTKASSVRCGYEAITRSICSSCPGDSSSSGSRQ